MHPRLAVGLALLSVSLLALPGCAGYRLGSVGGKNIQGVTSLYVPVVKNNSIEPGLAVPATTAIIRRFDNDGTLSTSQSQEADAQLDVTITDVQSSALHTQTYDVQAGTQFQVELIARVTFTNRKLGKKVFSDVELIGHNTYFAQRDQVEALRQALPMAEDDLAKQIVTLVTEGW